MIGLPKEIKKKILDLLSYEDLKNCKMVCKKLNFFIKENYAYGLGMCAFFKPTQIDPTMKNLFKVFFTDKPADYNQLITEIAAELIASEKQTLQSMHPLELASKKIESRSINDALEIFNQVTNNLVEQKPITAGLEKHCMIS